MTNNQSQMTNTTMTLQEEKQITAWHSKHTDDIQIHLIVTEDKRSSAFREFCENLSRLAPNIHIIREKEETGTPMIKISDALYYQAIPLGTELKPFLDALTFKETNDISLSFPSWNLGTRETIQPYLEKIDMPVLLRLYIAPQCPFCPAVVQQLLPLAGISEFIRLTITDGLFFPEIADAEKILSTPTLVLDEQFRWTGTVNLKEIMEIAINRDPARLSASSLEGMLKEGNAGQLARMMLNKHIIFPAFLDLIAHETWQIRLGAMAAMEEIAEENKTLANQVIDPLWKRFHEVNDQVKGDILYVFGEAGNNETRAMLETVLNGDYAAEVKEAAEEAAEKLEMIV